MGDSEQKKIRSHWKWRKALDKGPTRHICHGNLADSSAASCTTDSSERDPSHGIAYIGFNVTLSYLPYMFTAPDTDAPGTIIMKGSKLSQIA